MLGVAGGMLLVAVLMAAKRWALTGHMPWQAPSGTDAEARSVSWWYWGAELLFLLLAIGTALAWVVSHVA